MKKISSLLKLVFGIVISAVFLFLAFRDIKFSEVKHALVDANYISFIFVIIMLFSSHFIRAVRWQYLMRPLKKTGVLRLFSALLIGYMGNTVLPAHLGEFIRAYIIGKKENMPMSAVLGTVVVERILDMLSLFFLMLLALVLYPFPDEMKQFAMPMATVTLAMALFLILLKRNNSTAEKLLKRLISILPGRFAERLDKIIHSFLAGVVGLEKVSDYFYVVLQSLFIWGCYWLYLHVLFYAFHFADIYQLNLISSLVLLVVTTVAIVIPSSPGYVGTYHYLCQMTLIMFGVSRTLGLSYAIISHLLTTIPVFAVGLILFWKEGFSLMTIHKVRDNQEDIG